MINKSVANKSAAIIGSYRRDTQVVIYIKYNKVIIERDSYASFCEVCKFLRSKLTRNLGNNHAVVDIKMQRKGEEYNYRKWPQVPLTEAHLSKKTS